MNASARLVCCAPKYCHITLLLRELHWLPVKLHINFKFLPITVKILQDLAPSYLTNLISIMPVSRYELHQNNNGILLENPRFRTKKTMGDRSFMVAAPVLWNNLPLPFRQAKNIDTFKRILKTYLFSQAFC